MARTQIATDDFNRGSLGANWSQLNSSKGNVVTAGSTKFAGDTTRSANEDSPSAVWVGSGTFTADQYSSVLVGGSVLDFTYQIQALVRCSGSGATRNYYGVTIHGNSAPNYTYFFKVVAGTYTEFNLDTSLTWTAGDRLEIEAEGTTIRVLKSGVAFGGSFTVTDSSISGTSSAPGIGAAGDSGSNGFTGDDWQAGTLGSGAVLVRNRKLLLGVGA